LVSNPLVKLPIGSIKPAGWLKHQLDLMVDGMTGRLEELSEFLGPENGWFGGDSPGWEEQPYWFRGFHDLAVLTGDECLLATTNRWLEAVLRSQQSDGYFGATYHKRQVGQNGQVVDDLWPHMVMIDALISHHEHTADSRVPVLLERFFQYCRDLPDDRFIPKLKDDFGDWKPSVQRPRAGDMLPHIYWLYNRVGGEWLLDLATRFYHRIQPPVDEWLDHHVINFTQRFAYPGLYRAQSRAAWHLDLTEYWYAQHLATWGQQPRGIFGADENLRPGCVDPRQAFETCGFGEFAKNFYLLGRLTGKAIYADRCEDIILNHFPASQTPDLKALHYLTASNQPQLDASGQHEYRNQGHMICYSPHIYRCCQHNVAMTWPSYVQNLWQRTADGGLAAWMYAGCRVATQIRGVDIAIEETTEYPFRGRVEMKLHASAPVKFPLYLRVPRWCNGFEAAVNGQSVKVEAVPGRYLRIEREWSSGDSITIAMPIRLSLTTWPRTGSVTVDRGPLSYSVKIGERWQRYGGTDEWPEWEVFPTTPWNYGLVLDRQPLETVFSVKENGPVADQPWTPQAAPIEITARAKRIPNWGLENETVAELQPSPVLSREPIENITLVPLGCARLRIACLPVIGDGTDAREWEQKARPHPE